MPQPFSCRARFFNRASNKVPAGGRRRGRSRYPGRAGRSARLSIGPTSPGHALVSGADRTRPARALKPGMGLAARCGCVRVVGLLAGLADRRGVDTCADESRPCSTSQDAGSHAAGTSPKAGHGAHHAAPCRRISVGRAIPRRRPYSMILTNLSTDTPWRAASSFDNGELLDHCLALARRQRPEIVGQL